MITHLITVKKLKYTIAKQILQHMDYNLDIIDIDAHLNELIRYVLGIVKLKEIKSGAIYQSIIELYPKTDVVITAIKQMVKLIDNYLFDLVEEKIHHTTIAIEIIRTDQTYLRVVVLD
jgi:hypothetical protein